MKGSLLKDSTPEDRNAKSAQRLPSLGQRPSPWRGLCGLLLSCIVCLAIQITARAQSANDGFSPYVSSNVYSMALAPDGKIVLGGSFGQVGNPGESVIQRHGVARLNLDGTVDTSFPDVFPDAGVFAVAVQPDGKVLVGGTFEFISNQPRNYLVRFNVDGSLDSSFDPEPDGGVFSLALQPDGKILVGGNFTSIGNVGGRGFRWRVARLNADGTLDSSFVNAQLDNTAFTIALQPDGKVLVGGYFTMAGGQSRACLARLNSDGTLDTTFADPAITGATQPDPVGGESVPAVKTIALQADGGILFGGDFTTVRGQVRSRIARFISDGSLDTSFNSTDVTYSASPGSAEVDAIRVQADGKILIGGFFDKVMNASLSRSRIARLNPDGLADTSFNVHLNADATTGGVVYSILQQPDSKILVGGSFTSIAGNNHSNVARLYPNGKDDATLNPAPDGPVYATALDGEGRILVGGNFTSVGAQTRRKLARLNADGALDTTFPDLNINGPVYAIVSDGPILIGGNFSSVGGKMHNNLARILADGAVDASFTPDVNDSVLCIVQQADGKILIGGEFTRVNGVTRNRIARLNADGSLDQSFNLDVGSAVYAIALQPDGKILLGGSFTNVNGQSRAYLARINANTTLDTNFATSADDLVTNLALQPDNKIVVGGFLRRWEDSLIGG